MKRILYDVEMRWIRKITVREDKILQIRKLYRNDLGHFVWTEWEDVPVASEMDLTTN